MTGRNDPCPCGSGLKYKKCHGKFTMHLSDDELVRREATRKQQFR